MLEILRDENGRLSRDPEFLLTLPLIPMHLLKYIPREMKPGRPRPWQKHRIRRILNMRFGAPFQRCRGQSRAKVRRFEAQGDYSHSGWLRPSGWERWSVKPVMPKCGFCYRCRCDNVAGEFTKGTFYGLGPQTGTLGVGFCGRCLDSLHIPPSTAVRIARKEVEVLQQYGNVSKDTNYALKVMEAERKIAEQRVRLRTEVQMALDEIMHMRSILESGKRGESQMARELRRIGDWLEGVSISDKNAMSILKELNSKIDELLLTHTELTEYAGGKLKPMSYATRHRLIMEDTKTLSRLELNAQKVSTDLIHVDEVVARTTEMLNAVYTIIQKQHELEQARHVRGEEIETEGPIVEYMNALARQMIARIWSPDALERDAWKKRTRGKRKV